MPTNANSRPDEEHSLLRPYDEVIRKEKSEHIALARQEANRLQAEAKAVAAKYKQQIEDLNTRIDELAEELKTGKHKVPLQCFWQMDTNHWRLITSDGEVIRTEPTTMADRQAELSLS